MTRLTALDDAFLSYESPRTPAHVGSVAFFEGDPFRDVEGRFRLDEVRSHVASRLHLVPRLRQVVEETPLGVAHPLLVDDPAFDIAHHVKLVEVGAPGTEAQVFELACELHMELLDRSRPLWELWFVDGLADGRVGLIEKIHHAIADGISGVEVSMVLLDLEADPPRPPTPEWRPSPEPDRAELLRDGLAERAGRAADAVGGALRAFGHPIRSARTLRQDLEAVGSTLGGPLRAPSSSLNAEVGHRRHLAVVRRPLATVRERAHEHDATVNDLVLSAVSGGLRRLLTTRGELDDGSGAVLRALVPVSLHEGQGDLGNQVAGLLVDLPIGITDATARLRAVSDEVAEHKSSGEATTTGRLLRAADLLPPALARSVSRGVNRQPLINLVVTNVPGPDVPLYAMGARMLDAVPVVPVAGNLTVSVGILSYDGQLDVGLYADLETCPDLDVLAQGIGEAFDEHGCPAVAAEEAEGRA